MPTAEPQPISDHFQPALFFVIRPHCSNNDCKAWVASHPGPPQQGSKGWRLKEQLNSTGRADTILGYGVQKALFVPKN